MSAQGVDFYGRGHRLERQKWGRVVKSGLAKCVRCGKPISPDGRWDLDHGDVKVVGQYLGPAHVSCNRSAGAKSQARKASGFRWSRSW